MSSRNESTTLDYGFWRPVDESANPYGPSVLDLIKTEQETPVKLGKDHSLRAKILDACGMTCTFCHNEGTPVANGTSTTLGRVGLSDLRKSARVSVFSETNGVNFIPGVMQPDDPNFAEVLTLLSQHLDCQELHLTGGEPSLHPRLVDIVKVASDSGYSVKMTSNGERGARSISECAQAGLEKINFSIFGTTPEELAMVQHPRFQNPILAAKKIDSLKQSIAAAAENGIGMSANIVMSDIYQSERVVRLIDEYDSRLEIRILPDLDKGDSSMFAIYRLLGELGAVPRTTYVEAGSSNARVAYELPDGREIYFKQTRPTRLEACVGCQFNNPADCKEGYYGLRLYVDNAGQYMVGVCIQRMDLTLPVEDFVDSGLAKQVVDFRESEYTRLSKVVA